MFRHSTGHRTGSIVDPTMVSGHVLNISAAAKVYMVHNHPGGNTSPSNEDLHITRLLRNIFSAHGIEMSSLIVAGQKYRNIHRRNAETIQPTRRTTKIPVKRDRPYDTARRGSIRTDRQLRRGHSGNKGSVWQPGR
ncbi:MAG: JAB domain-containing protein [Thermodesulfobacteriota bacterium]|nr:JAB domain-containing protein [Thermodesulfobacteriota bacterium]